MKLLKETINKCYEDCPYNQETFDGGSGCMMVNKDITKYEDNGFPYFCPLPDAESEYCEWELVPSYIVSEYNYKTSCEYITGQFLKGDYKFCPNCGKPIKIKE